MTHLNIPKYLEIAYSDGFSCQDEYNNTHYLHCCEIGDLKIADGKIVACDPFLYNNDSPFTTNFPTGVFPVQLAVARIENDERVASSYIGYDRNGNICRLVTDFVVID